MKRWCSVAAYGVRRRVNEVRDRLTQPPSPRYKMVVQLESDGSLVSFTSRVPLSPGTFVTADIRGELAPAVGVNSRIVGIVVSREVQL